jgi:hypothetical protein
MANLTNIKYADNGLVLSCEFDGIQAVYVNPDWTGQHLIEMLGSAGAGAGFLFFLFPGTALLGATLGAVAYLAYNREGYYKLAYDGRLTKELIHEGSIYKNDLR